MLVPLTEEKNNHLPQHTWPRNPIVCESWFTRCGHIQQQQSLDVHMDCPCIFQVLQRFMCFFADSSCPSHIPWLHDLFPCGIPHYACQWAGQSEVRRVNYHDLCNMQPGIKSLLIEAILDFSKGCLFLISSVQFSCSVMSDSLWLHELQQARPPCASPTPRVYSNSFPSINTINQIERWVQQCFASN